MKNTILGLMLDERCSDELNSRSSEKQSMGWLGAPILILIEIALVPIIIGTRIYGVDGTLENHLLFVNTVINIVVGSEIAIIVYIITKYNQSVIDKARYELDITDNWKQEKNSFNLHATIIYIEKLIKIINNFKENSPNTALYFGTIAILKVKVEYIRIIYNRSDLYDENLDKFIAYLVAIKISMNENDHVINFDRKRGHYKLLKSTVEYLHNQMKSSRHNRKESLEKLIQLKENYSYTKLLT